jgi:hypothetical protein
VYKRPNTRGHGSVRRRPGQDAQGAGGTAASDRAREARELGEALAALVRCRAQRDRLAEGHARRFMQLFEQQDVEALDWLPTELRAGGKLVLAAAEDAGQFILPAYAAGLRGLCLLPEATDAELLAFADELAKLDQGELHPKDFGDLLWRGGVTGMTLRMAEPFDQVGEFVLPDHIDTAACWEEKTRVAMERWNDVAWKASEVHPRDELQRRYAAPVERLCELAVHGGLEPAPAATDSLASVLANEAAWAQLEMDALMGSAELRETIAARQLAARVTWLVAAAPRVDERMVEFLADLSEAEEDLAAAIDRADVGEAMAALAVEAGYEREAVLELVDVVGDATVKGFLRCLSERALGEGGALTLLAALMHHWGPRRLMHWAEGERMPPALVAGLMKAGLDEGVEADELVRELDRLSPEAAATALSALPELRCKAGRRVAALIRENPARCPRLIARLLKSHDGQRLVGAALLESAGERWDARALQGALATLVEVGSGSEYVLPLWRARSAALDVRLAALGALSQDRGLAREAVKRRPTDVMEPAEIRAAMKELRGRLSA